ncbi:MAG: hypothetical protein JWN30_2807 [Bacilli bacterium]|nr:hypothetical protein [Bacilli bacterium]
MSTLFKDLDLSEDVLRSLEEMGFEETTPIQAETIPLARQGLDLIGQAQTGTGKTAAFTLPCLEKIDYTSGIQVLVMTPTRELAIQVADEASRLGKFTRLRTLAIYGGQPIDRQIKTLRTHPQIIVGTPGRIIDHIRRKTLKLSTIHTVILDEADEMLDMGFLEDIETILAETPDTRQTLLFSATMPAPIKRLAQKFMKSPRHIAIQPQGITAPKIAQVYYEVLERQKVDALCRVFDVEAPELAVIFCRTKKGVDELQDNLKTRGYLSSGLHGDMTQRERDQVMNSFRNGTIDILIATDVAARGLDVSGVTHVCNFDIPQDTDSYVHRIGRTGRAGKEGVAMTFITPREFKLLRMIEEAIGKKLHKMNLPTVAELESRQQARIMERVLNVMNGDIKPYFSGLAQQLLDQHGSLEVIASALQIIGEDLVGDVELTSIDKNRDQVVDLTDQRKKERSYSSAPPRDRRPHSGGGGGGGGYGQRGDGGRHSQGNRGGERRYGQSGGTGGTGGTGGGGSRGRDKHEGNGRVVRGRDESGNRGGRRRPASENQYV